MYRGTGRMRREHLLLSLEGEEFVGPGEGFREAGGGKLVVGDVDEADGFAGLYQLSSDFGFFSKGAGIAPIAEVDDRDVRSWGGGGNAILFAVHF